MATNKTSQRIINEVTKLQALGKGNKPCAIFLLDKSPLDDPSSNLIIGRILPQSEIYKEAAFQIQIKLTDNFPFKPPEIRFLTPIYHPNVNGKGEICDAVITGLNPDQPYKPTTTLADIVTSIVNMIDNPDVGHGLDAATIAEFTSDRPAFDRKAAQMVKEHGLKRQ